MVNHERLDDLSDQFARELFSAFPAWKHFAKTVKGTDGIASVQVDVAQEGTNRVLHLSTAGGKVTIGFDEWHTHVGPFLGIDVEESVRTAIGIIESFITEETVVKISYRDGEWIESSLSYRVAPGEPKPSCTTRVCSWRGTYDDVVDTL